MPIANPYAARPGTIAYRAIAWLETQPPGTEAKASQLADALQIDVNNLLPCLTPAVEHGALLRYTKNGMSKPNFYRLPDASSPHTQGRGSQHVLKAEAARPDATDREKPADASPVGGPMGVGQPAAAGPVGAAPGAQRAMDVAAARARAHVPAATSRTAKSAVAAYIAAIGPDDARERHQAERTWWCSDGRMVIETDSSFIEFSPDEAQRFLALARRVGGAA